MQPQRNHSPLLFLRQIPATSPSSPTTYKTYGTGYTRPHEHLHNAHQSQADTVSFSWFLRWASRDLINERIIDIIKPSNEKMGQCSKPQLSQEFEHFDSSQLSLPVSSLMNERAQRSLSSNTPKNT